MAAVFRPHDPYTGDGWDGDVVDHHTVQKYALGQERYFINANGLTCKARYYKNEEASAAWDLTKGLEQKSGDNAGKLIIATNANTNLGKGAPLSAVPAAAFGWVQTEGENATVHSGAAFSADDPLKFDTNGDLIKTAAGDGTSTLALDVVATALEAASGAGEAKKVNWREHNGI